MVSGNEMLTGTVSSQTYGIDFFGGYGTVTNAGVIARTNKSGILFHAGGVVTNQSGGTISGKYDGVDRADAVTNAGLIAGNFDAILMFGGSVSNQSSGTLSGLGTGVLFRTAGTVTNAGLITAANLYGVQFAYGGNAISQSGATIAGKINGIIAGRDATTIVNAGTISGSKSAVVLHSGYNNRVIADPGAVFVGTVNGGSILGAYVSTLELASGATPGLISGLGSQFRNFARTTIDAGAMWTLTGTNYVVGGTTLTNAGELAVLNGNLSVAGTLLNNGLIQDNAATMTVAKAGRHRSDSDRSGWRAHGDRLHRRHGVDHSRLQAACCCALKDTVTNAGVIAGGTSAAGVQLVAGGTVTNLGIGTITGAAEAIYIGGATGSVINAGTLAGTNFAGVFLSAGGGVTNQSSGTIIGRATMELVSPGAWAPSSMRASSTEPAVTAFF